MHKQILCTRSSVGRFTRRSGGAVARLRSGLPLLQRVNLLSRYTKEMVYVYVLQLANKKLYVGSTQDLRRRIKEHTAGKVPFTHPFLPVQLVYYEAYLENADARMREKYLKTGNGRAQLRKQIKHFLKHP